MSVNPEYKSRLLTLFLYLSFYLLGDHHWRNASNELTAIKPEAEIDARNDVTRHFEFASVFEKYDGGKRGDDQRNQTPQICTGKRHSQFSLSLVRA